MDARAALRWVRLERDAYAALAAYHERRAAERDTHTRQRLRALGMWRLMGKLGLDVETSERSRVMVLAWLRACRDRLRASSSLDGRAPPSARAGARRRSPSRSSSDDGEPGPRRWRDPGPATLARRSSATRTLPEVDPKRRPDARASRGSSDEDSSLWSGSRSRSRSRSRRSRRSSRPFSDDASDASDDDDDDDDGASSVVSYSTLASTRATGLEPYDDEDPGDAIGGGLSLIHI